MQCCAGRRLPGSPWSAWPIRNPLRCRYMSRPRSSSATRRGPLLTAVDHDGTSDVVNFSSVYLSRGELGQLPAKSGLSGPLVRHRSPSRVTEARFLKESEPYTTRSIRYGSSKDAPAGGPEVI